MEPSLDYPTFFKYVGQLFIESRHELEKIIQDYNKKEFELTERLKRVEQERDDALKLVQAKNGQS